MDVALPLPRGEAYKPLEVFGDLKSLRTGRAGKGAFAGDQVVVRFKKDATEKQIKDLLFYYGLQAKARIPSLNCYLLNFLGPIEAPYVVSILNESSLIESAELNHLLSLGATPLDDEYSIGNQWTLDFIGLPAT